MILCHDRSIGNIAAAAEEYAPGTQTCWHPFLLSADWTLAVFALGALLFFLLLWIRRGRHDPLRLAPARPNHVREDAVLIAVGSYLLIASLFSLVPGLVPDPENVDARSIARGMMVGSATQFAAAAVCLLIAHSRFVGGVRAFLIRPVDESLLLYQGGIEGGSSKGDAVWHGHSGNERGDQDRRRRSIVLWVLIASPVAIGLCSWVGELTFLAIKAIAPTFEPPSHPTLEALGGGVSPGMTVALWIGAAAIAPAAEELFFRGLLQTWLVRLLGSRWGAILAASVVFGLVHSGQPHAIPALVVLAVILGLAYEMTGVATVPILIHALFNLKTLTWQALAAGA